MRYENYLKESTLKKAFNKKAHKSAIRKMLDYIASVYGGMINGTDINCF